MDFAASLAARLEYTAAFVMTECFFVALTDKIFRQLVFFYTLLIGKKLSPMASHKKAAKKTPKKAEEKQAESDPPELVITPVSLHFQEIGNRPDVRLAKIGENDIKGNPKGCTTFGAIVLFLRLQEKIGRLLDGMGSAWWAQSPPGNILQSIKNPWVENLRRTLIEAGFPVQPDTKPTDYFSRHGEHGYRTKSSGQYLYNALANFKIFSDLHGELDLLGECRLLQRITASENIGDLNRGGVTKSLRGARNDKYTAAVENLEKLIPELPRRAAASLLQEIRHLLLQKNKRLPVRGLEARARVDGYMEQLGICDLVTSVSLDLLRAIVGGWGTTVSESHIEGIKDRNLPIIRRLAKQLVDSAGLEENEISLRLAKLILYYLVRGFVPMGNTPPQHFPDGIGSVTISHHTHWLETDGNNTQALMPSDRWLFLDKRAELFARIDELQTEVPRGEIYQWDLSFTGVASLQEGASRYTDPESIHKIIETVRTAIQKTRDKEFLATRKMTSHSTTAQAERAVKKAFSSFVCKVPPPVADFSSQGAALQMLHEAFEKSESNRFQVHAAVGEDGGIGKTQLVRKFAWTFIERFDGGSDFPFADGMFEINLKAHNYSPVGDDGEKALQTKPLTVTEARKSILTSFGISETQIDERETNNGLEAYYQSELKRRHCLLILDNAADVEQVRPLLPESGSNTFVIVTARTSIAGLEPITLARWDELQILQYLKDSHLETRFFAPCAGPEFYTQQQLLVSQLKALSGGLPLVVKMICAFALHSGWSSSVLDLFAEQKDKSGAPLPAALALCLRLLSDEEKTQRFEDLAIFQVHFDAAAAATVWGLDSIDEAARLLAEFERRGLLMEETSFEITVNTPDPKTNESEFKKHLLSPCYRMHDLVRQAASERLKTRNSGSHIQELVLRFVIHYIGRQAYQNELILKTGALDPRTFMKFSRVDTFDIGASWFDREELNLDLAFEFCQRRLEGQAKDRLLSLMAGVATRAWDLLLSAKTRRERIDAGLCSVKRLIGSAADLPLFQHVLQIEEAMHTNSLGLAYRHLADRDEAEKRFNLAFELSSKAGWIWGKAVSKGNGGNISQERGNDASDAKAIAYMEEALAMHQEAKRYSEHLQQTTPDRLGLAQDWGNAAIVYIDLWKLSNLYSYYFNLALSAYQERIRIADFIQDDRGGGNGHGNLAYAHLLKYIQLMEAELPAVKEQRFALLSYERAIKAHEKARNLRGQAACKGNRLRAILIFAHFEPENRTELLIEAEGDLRDSYKLFVEVGDMLGQKVALMHRRSLRLAQGDAKGAAKDMAAVRELEKKLNIANMKPERELKLGEEKDLPRHLADKYGKLSHIILAHGDYQHDPLVQKVLAARNLCADYLEKELEVI